MVKRVAAFVRLSRSEFLLGGIVAAALGSSVAAYERGRFDWAAFGLAQFALIAIHAMTHFVNDYYDRETDALSVRTPYSGGSGVLVDGPLPASVALIAAFVLAGLGLFGICSLFVLGKPLAAVIGLVVLALAWAYSAPPRLAARGLGEIDTSLVVAILTPLCAYAAQTNSLDARAIVATLPGAVAMFAMMLCVEAPDVAADAATGKRTLLVRFGVARIARAIPYIAFAFVIAMVCALLAGAPPSFAMLEALAAIPLLRVTRSFMRMSDTPVALEETAARGVTLFFLVEFFGALGFGCALR